MDSSRVKPNVFCRPLFEEVRAKTRDLEEAVARHHAIPLNGILRHHGTVDRGVKRQRLHQCAGLLQSIDIGGANVPEQQALPGGVVQLLSAPGKIGIRRLRELLPRAVRQQVFLFRR